MLLGEGVSEPFIDYEQLCFSKGSDEFWITSISLCYEEFLHQLIHR